MGPSGNARLLKFRFLCGRQRGIVPWKAASSWPSRLDTFSLCFQESEPIDQLLVDCSSAHIICFKVFSSLERPDLAPSDVVTLQESWLAALQIGPAKKVLKVRALILLAFHSIWLERNGRVFHNTTKSVERVLDEIMAEAERRKTVGFIVRE